VRSTDLTASGGNASLLAAATDEGLGPDPALSAAS
jgi:hypothetical protein